MCSEAENVPWRAALTLALIALLIHQQNRHRGHVDGSAVRVGAHRPRARRGRRTGDVRAATARWHPTVRATAGRLFAHDGPEDYSLRHSANTLNDGPFLNCSNTPTGGRRRIEIIRISVACDLACRARWPLEQRSGAARRPRPCSSPRSHPQARSRAARFGGCRSAPKLGHPGRRPHGARFGTRRSSTTRASPRKQPASFSRSRAKAACSRTWPGPCG